MVDGSYSVSYLYDTNTGETQWLTEFDQNDFSKSGEFQAVNDAGVICGASKDPDLLITYSDMFGTSTRPANSAAIWKDGKCTLLYYGDFDTSKFEILGDGSQATDISADSKPSADISAQAMPHHSIHVCGKRATTANGLSSGSHYLKMPKAEDLTSSLTTALLL